MNVVFCFVLAATSQVQQGQTPGLLTPARPQATQAEQDEGRPYHDIEREMRDAFKQLASARQVPAKSPQIQKLAKLHREIVKHPRFIRDPMYTLEQYRLRIRSRLLQEKRKLKSFVAREAKANGRKAPTPDQLALANELSIVLGQQLSMVEETLGGPAALLGAQGNRGGAAVAAANGQDLIELIERTIDPDFWDTNGGPGSMFYYPPLHALVIRATQEVHEKIGGVVGQIRRINN